jgi:hypothetical protein
MVIAVIAQIVVMLLMMRRRRQFCKKGQHLVYIRFEALKAVITKISIFLGYRQCSSFEVVRRFEETRQRPRTSRARNQRESRWQTTFSLKRVKSKSVPVRGRGGR